MNTPIAVAMNTTRKKIIRAINESGLPASVLEEIARSIFYEVSQKAKEELEEGMQSMQQEEDAEC